MKNNNIYNKLSYKMINISNKKISFRRACVYGEINIGKNVFNLIKNKKIEKGDPLILAEIAGINAVKKTSDIILLCHPINIESTFINVIMDEKNYKINIYCGIFANSKTGVEVEGFCGVMASLLTIYDLTKKFNPFSTIQNIKLLFKDGGENGLILGSTNNIPIHLKNFFYDNKISFYKIKIVVLTISDRSSNGNYEDISGQIITDFFKTRNGLIIKKLILPDDKIILQKIIKIIHKKYNPDIIISTGGTGLDKKDITNNALITICDKYIPGIPEFLRINNVNTTTTHWLSSSFAGIYKKTLILCLSGNPTSIFENLITLEELIFYSIKSIKNNDTLF